MLSLILHAITFICLLISLYFLDKKRIQNRVLKDRIKQLERIKTSLENINNELRIDKEFSNSNKLCCENVKAVNVLSRYSIDLEYLSLLSEEDLKHVITKRIKDNLFVNMLDEIMSYGRLETQFNIDQNTYDFLYELKVIPTSEHLTFEGSMKEIKEYIKGGNQ